MLARVATYTTAIEAHLARLRLEVEEIPAYVIHEHHIGIDWTMSLALGGVKVCVHPADLGRAREIIRAHDRGEFALGEAAPPACPRCGSREIGRERFSWPAAVLMVHFLTLPLPFRWAAQRCRACGHGLPVDPARATPLAAVTLAAAIAALTLGSLAVMGHCTELSILNGIGLAAGCR